VASYGAGSGLLRQPASASPWWGLAAACVSLRRLTAASAPPTLQPGRFAGQGYASFLPQALLPAGQNRWDSILNLFLRKRAQQVSAGASLAAQHKHKARAQGYHLYCQPRAGAGKMLSLFSLFLFWMKFMRVLLWGNSFDVRECAYPGCDRFFIHLQRKRLRPFSLAPGSGAPTKGTHTIAPKTKRRTTIARTKRNPSRNPPMGRTNANATFAVKRINHPAR